MAERVIITGAASGIGAAGAGWFAARGATVVGFDRSDDAGAVVFGALGEPNAYRSVDLTDPAALAAGLDEAVSVLGGLDLLWLNAGVMTRAGGPVEQLSFDAYRRVFDVNVGANVEAIRLALPHLAAHGGGDIVVTASAAGLTPFSPDPIYTATKHAVIGLVRSLGPVLERDGVRINAICPGATNTPMAVGAAGREDVAGLDVLQPPTRIAEGVEAILERGGSGEAWTVLPNRPPTRIEFPELRGRGLVFPPA